jgi:hypothetical protein
VPILYQTTPDTPQSFSTWYHAATNNQYLELYLHDPAQSGGGGGSEEDTGWWEWRPDPIEPDRSWVFMRRVGNVVEMHAKVGCYTGTAFDRFRFYGQGTPGFPVDPGLRPLDNTWTTSTKLIPFFGGMDPAYALSGREFTTVVGDTDQDGSFSIVRINDDFEPFLSPENYQWVDYYVTMRYLTNDAFPPAGTFPLVDFSQATSLAPPPPMP